MMLGKMSDLGTMPEKIMKSGGDVREGEEIRASSGEGSGRVPARWDPGEYRKMVRESTRKVGSGRVPKMWDPGEYRKGGI